MTNRSKKFIKLIIPPIFLELWRNMRSIKNKRNENYTFEGVYDHINQVPIKNDGYRNADLIEKMYEHSKEELSDLKLLPEPSADSQITNLLPFLISILCKDKNYIKILDFGGGMGIAYMHCIKLVEMQSNFEFHIIETAQVYEKGKDLFKDNKQVFIYNSIPESLKEVDVVNIGSALQYTDDYSDLLSRLIEKKPRFILLTNHYMGEVKTYATCQVNMPGTSIPYWIFDIREIIKIMMSEGYILIFKSANLHNRSFHNVPDKYEVKDSCNLLFFKSEPH